MSGQQGDKRDQAHPHLETVREDGEPARRRASRSEFSDDEWRLVGELADHPNRLVVTAVHYGGEAYAEIDSPAAAAYLPRSLAL
jgi:hypothetical protein